MYEGDLTDEEVQMVVALMKLGQWGWNTPGRRTSEFVVEVKGVEWFRRWKERSLQERIPTYRRIWAYFPAQAIPAGAQPNEHVPTRAR